MYTKSIFILCMLALIACRNPSTDAAISDEEVAAAKAVIPGTHIYLQKPDSFEFSKEFIGLEKGESVIQFFDLFGGDYYANADSFTRENFEARGIEVLDFEELMIDSFPAKMVLISGQEDAKSLQVVFGDNDFSAMGVAIIPNTELENVDVIRETFFSMEYDKGRDIDPFETAFFELDDSNNTFRFANAISNMYIYAENGERKESYEGDNIYMIAQFPTDPTQAFPQALFVANLNGLVGRGLEVESRTETDRKELNGLPCYEELIVGTLNNSETQMLITSVVDGGKSLLITGTAKSNFEETLVSFKSLTDKIRMK